MKIFNVKVDENGIPYSSEETKACFLFPKTRVINIKSGQPYDVYIGRWNGRYKLQASIWGNPFKIGQDGTGEEVIQKYREHVLNSPNLMKRLPELKGKVLACWCKTPENPNAPCHGDVLVDLVEEIK